MSFLGKKKTVQFSSLVMLRDWKINLILVDLKSPSLTNAIFSLSYNQCFPTKKKWGGGGAYVTTEIVLYVRSIGECNYHTDGFTKKKV